ncbi:MAG: CaiB/BaiF CoA-transferase family protein [Actinomycetota bacterium]|nr:CaiB/BaiF CoA-transferase family protein [Actinomycetota bacterium]
MTSDAPERAPADATAGDPGPRALPLTGVKVLDLGRIYQGPWCGMMLALAGADVVKVEQPGGEPARLRGNGGATVPLAMLNANKRDITLDLKHPRGRELFVELAMGADVVVENFGPGTMDRLGIGPDVLLAANPRLVYGAATGYGIDGPDRDQLAMDVTIQAHGGIMSVTGFPGQPPVKAGVAFVDFLGGTHLYGGIVTALYERERTGRGRVVDVAMIDTIYPTLASNLSAYYRDGTVERSGNGHGGGALVPYDVFPTSDGHIALIVVTEQHWRNLCAAIGRPELAEDERYRSNGRRFHHADEVNGLVAAWTSSHTRAEVRTALGEARVPAAAVREIGEVVEDRHLHERGALQHLDHPELGPIVVPHSPMRYRGSDLAELRPSPALGEHNAEVYADWLGLSADDIATLAAEAVI